MCVMFVYMRLLTEEVAVCKNMCKCMRDKEGMRLWISLHVLCNKKTDLIHAPTFTWPLYMFIRNETSIHSWPTMRWQSRTLHWHKHSSSIVTSLPQWLQTFPGCVDSSPQPRWRVNTTAGQFDQFHQLCGSMTANQEYWKCVPAFAHSGSVVQCV